LNSRDASLRDNEKYAWMPNINKGKRRKVRVSY
jgi:hypothetical protein